MSEGRRYEVLDVLGHGGFGSVYRARLLGREGFSKYVALKISRDSDATDAGELRRLRDEARVLGLLRHRAIVSVEGLVQLDGRWTVVMEYIDGVDLLVLLEGVAIPAQVALEVVAEAASALHVAFHTKGPSGKPLALCHRDLKPANLLLTEAGEVKILDFGIAQAQFESREAVTQMMANYGSEGYMAPERLDSLGSGPEADVYSLGVTLYELLVRERLGRTSAHPGRHAENVERGMAKLAEAVDQPELVELVAAMLTYEPDERPSAREVERRCLKVRHGIDGLLLRDWTEREIPKAMQAKGQPPELEGMPTLIGKVLEESGEAFPTDDELGPVPIREGVDDDDSEIEGATQLFVQGERDHVLAAPSGQRAGPGLHQAATRRLDNDAEEDTGFGDRTSAFFGGDDADEPRTDEVAAAVAAPLTEPTEIVKTAAPLPPPSAESSAVIGALAGMVVVLVAVLGVGLGLVIFNSKVWEEEPPPVGAITAPPAAPLPARPAPEPEAEPEPEDTEPEHPETEDTEPSDAFAAAVLPPAGPTPPPRPTGPTGTVTVTGDRATVRLVGGGHRYSPGAVPVGTYTVEASFGGDPVTAGTVEVSAGTTTTLECNALFTRCSVK